MEMWFLGKMKRIQFTDKKANEAVLQETDENGTLNREIRHSHGILGM